ncbi:MAG: hypothetical protein JNL74_00465 [Fibrobacteres bacterium]|nr:hypothetical protein [Fibrobacterota bacterium]
MNTIKRLICEYDKPVLYIHIDGNVVSGDIINFSYSMNRRLTKIEDEFYIFCDLSNAHFALMDGLAHKIFETFFEDALQMKLIRCAVILPDALSNEMLFTKSDPKIRFFKNEYSAALSWLSRNGSMQKQESAESHALISR